MFADWLSEHRKARGRIAGDAIGLQVEFRDFALSVARMRAEACRRSNDEDRVAESGHWDQVSAAIDRSERRRRKRSQRTES